MTFANRAPDPCDRCKKDPAPSALEDGAEAGELVEGVVVELNRICKAATFEFAMTVGRLIIRRCYAGNLDTWRIVGRRMSRFASLLGIQLSP